MSTYIYNQQGWPTVTWDFTTVNAVLAEATKEQQKLKQKIEMLPEFLRREANAYMLTEELIGNFELADVELKKEEVLSFFAQKTGTDLQHAAKYSEQVANWSDLLWDASQHAIAPLTEERLFEWHNALFPTGRSGAYRIQVGAWRNNPIDRPLEVFWGVPPHEKVMFEAPSSEGLSKDMHKYLSWFNTKFQVDPLIKAGIAHLGFVTIHPFDDGNGRIARAISDFWLARADKTSERYYSMSSQILVERKKYYDVLQKVQHSQGDITEWMLWFLECLKNALLVTQDALQNLLRKSDFWRIHEKTAFNERQRMMLNKLFDGFEGKLKSSKWAKMTKCSTDTALRDIKDLLEKGILRQESKGGRSTNYELEEF